MTGKRTGALAAVTTALLLATGGAAQASTPTVRVSPKNVKPGSALLVVVGRTHGRRCTLSVRADYRGAMVKFKRRVSGGKLSLMIAASTRPGQRVLTVTCGRHRKTVRFTVLNSDPTPGPPSPDPDYGEHYTANGLPDGQGNPSDYTVAGPPDAGGAGFSTYWPLPTGMQARITEGQGGSYSHNTIYTRDAVDLGVSRGTEIRAGLNGVIARVSTGCAEGNYSCGSGYGNYVYLKASDGTCAIMAHLSEIDVALGQQVAQYALIGRSGNTGNSTGPHLHYDHVNCTNNQSIGWAPTEGGALTEGTTITSQNAAAPASGPGPGPQPQPVPQPTPAPTTYAETVGGNTNTWTNYSNAGGTQGPTIPSNQTVQVACKVQGFRVQDGDTWWYRIASSPWNGQYYGSADAFYNNGQTSGTLHGTPFVDNSVPDC